MAENNEEINVINHLLQVEKNASSLIDDAIKDAEEKLSQARAKSNLEFKEKYDKIVADLEADYQKNLEKLQKEHEEKVRDFKDSLLSKNQDKKAFNELLDRLLVASK